MAKPASGTALNAGHALAPNYACWAFLEGSGLTSADSVSGNTHALALTNNAAIVAWSTDANGDACVNFPNASATPITMAAPVTIPGSHSWSVALDFTKAADDTNDTPFGNGNNSLPEYWEFHTTGLYEVINDGVNFTAYNFSTPTSFTSRALYGFTFDHSAGSNRLRMYKNGTEVASSPISGAASLRLYLSIIGSGYDGVSASKGLQGKISLLYIYDDRVLSAGEWVTLTADPYAMFGTGSSTAFTKSQILTQAAVRRASNF